MPVQESAQRSSPAAKPAPAQPAARGGAQAPANPAAATGYADGAASVRPAAAGGAAGDKPRGPAAPLLGARRVQVPLRLHREPSLRGPVLRVLPKMAVVQAFDDTSEADGHSWVYVRVGGAGGYVDAKLLTTIDQSEAITAKPREGGTPTPLPASLGTWVTKDHSRVHVDAGLDSPVVAVMLRGALVDAYADRRKVGGIQWIMIKVGDTIGYIAEPLLTPWKGRPGEKAPVSGDTHAGGDQPAPQPAPARGDNKDAAGAKKDAGGAKGGQGGDAKPATAGGDRPPDPGAVRVGSGAGQKMLLGQTPLRRQPDDHTKTSVVVPRGAAVTLTGATADRQDGSWTEVRYTIDGDSGTAGAGWVRTGELGGVDAALNSRYRDEYEKAHVKQSGPVEVKLLTREARVIMANKPRYLRVASLTGMPWYVIGLIHMREASFDFNTCLHNGDPLGVPTRHVPKGLLFHTWEEAATDAISRERSDFSKGILEGIEAYNGLGYRKKGVASPYLWSGTDQYKSGKYTGDGVYNAQAVDQQAGVVGVLKALEQLGVQVDHATL